MREDADSASPRNGAEHGGSYAASPRDSSEVSTAPGDKAESAILALRRPAPLLALAAGNPNSNRPSSAARQVAALLPCAGEDADAEQRLAARFVRRRGEDDRPARSGSAPAIKPYLAAAALIAIAIGLPAAYFAMPAVHAGQNAERARTAAVAIVNGPAQGNEAQNTLESIKAEQLAPAQPQFPAGAQNWADTVETFRFLAAGLAAPRRTEDKEYALRLLERFSSLREANKP